MPGGGVCSGLQLRRPFARYPPSSQRSQAPVGRTNQSSLNGPSVQCRIRRHILCPGSAQVRRMRETDLDPAIKAIFGQVFEVRPEEITNQTPKRPQPPAKNPRRPPTTPPAAATASRARPPTDTQHHQRKPPRSGPP